MIDSAAVADIVVAFALVVVEVLRQRTCSQFGGHLSGEIPWEAQLLRWPMVAEGDVGVMQ
jgi:hypothetical protein